MILIERHQFVNIGISSDVLQLHVCLRMRALQVPSDQMTGSTVIKAFSLQQHY